MTIGSAFNELGTDNPTENQMSPRDFAAMLICNDKQRFQISVYVNWTWKPFGFPPTQPWDLRMGATQGHSNKTVNPYDLHHALTFEESCCLGWIFHVTSADNRQSIEQKGLLKDPRGGKGRSGRDSVHFMYHNDHSNGYIRMADGTTVPRTYRNPIYCVLVPQAAFEFQLFLSKNGVILIYDDIPPHLLKIVDQMPTIACPLMRAGRGRILSPTVTGGVWPDDITYDRMRKEKGVGFVPGGEVPPKVRTTAWDFMGQNIPENYGMLVFAQPLSTPDAFDPSSESIHGLLSGSSHQREEPSNDDEPMSDPCTQPRGSSHQGEEPQRDTSAVQERWWEDNRSSPGSPEEEYGAEHDSYEDYFQKEDEVMEQAAAIWEGENVEDDEVIDRVASSASATNPWFLYEAGIICSRQANGSVELNSSGERAINLREWAFLLSHQRIKLRRQELKRPEWEKLPWTGHLCYLLTRAWEIGRAKSQFKRDKDYTRMRDFSENVRRSGCDWMRGQGPPNNCENRRNVPMNSWHETWLNYQRDLDIQEDMEWLSEAV